MKDKKAFEILYAKYIEGSLSAEELLEWVEVFQHPENEQYLTELIGRTFESYSVPEDPEAAKQAFHRFERLIDTEDTSSDTPSLSLNKSIFRIFRQWKYVAAAALLSIASYGIYQYTSQTAPQDRIADLAKSDVAPGGNKAILKLEDGSEMKLGPQGELIVNGDRLEDGAGNMLLNGQSRETWQSIEVPKGGQYTVILSDGTKVWLNADSKMKFPVEFAAQQRQVQLQGEAYFEVTKDASKPFIVKSAEQQIEVLGTWFNVSAYPDEPTVTTLVSGKVNVSAFGKQVALTPGMQSVANDQQLQSKQVDVEPAVAWKDAKFVFVKEPLEDIIRKLERWYNVDFVIQPGSEELKKKTFSGSLSRNSKLSEILNLFKITETIRFEITERRVYLMK
ncbi:MULTISPECIES: FecR family protein [unclassified Sphingobacterium]|uniref:FecR family protein n=1 Tax=unclassified Sphingobacterium TaxID=2609468 RepID=UPI0025E3395A|nr:MULTISPECIES: FecR domain-containing protein [unclassified Sphingobacterium]